MDSGELPGEFTLVLVERSVLSPFFLKNKEKLIVYDNCIADTKILQLLQ